MSKIKNILITSNSENFAELSHWCNDHAINLIQASQITTQPILNVEIIKTDWLFFVSPQAATIYLENFPIHAKKIAVYGHGTAAAIEKANLTIDFKGDHKDEPKEIGKKFNAILSPNETVLFAISQRSQKSISSQIPTEQRVEKIIYTTQLNPTRFAIIPDVALFTSPSNFESYCELNDIHAIKRIVALGKTTAKFMNNHPNIHVLDEPNADAFIKFLERI